MVWDSRDCTTKAYKTETLVVLIVNLFFGIVALVIAIALRKQI